MRNRDKWQPSKFVYRNGKLRASRNPQAVAVGSRLMVDLIAEFYSANLPQNAKGRLLDLGCGQVPLFDAYKGLVTDIVCVDWKITTHKSEHLDFECDLTKRLPFQEEEFDTIILSDVLEHLPQPEQLWKEMARVLSIHGRIILNVPFYYCIHEQPHDYHRYTEFMLRRYVEDSGLRLLQLNSLGGVPEIAADLFSKYVTRKLGKGRSLAALAQWLAEVFIKTKMGKRASATSRDRFPFGYFLVAEKPGPGPTCAGTNEALEFSFQ